MTTSAMSINHLHKSYGSFKAVEDLSFEVHTAECFGLLGPNGAGKTTTMKVLYSKATPDPHPDFKMTILGFNPLTDSLQVKALSAIVPQQDNLDLELSVLDNLRIYAGFYGLTSEKATQRIQELLTFMELKEKAQANVRELSGGMKRRLTIARALLNKPKFLILDEPTTGLDPQVRHLIWNKLRELKEQGVTILLTTHYMEEAFQICDRILVMDHGKKILEGNPRTLLTENIERHVCEIYGLSASAPCIEDIQNHHLRYEFHSDTLFVFSDDANLLAHLGETLCGTDYYVRHSNLEDVFLKVTGRALNEFQ